MLVSMHVKNLAIIDELEVEFSQGLNVLTGETGAGKSIIIGSITAALGGKVPKDIVRKGCEYALVDLVFTLDSKEQIEAVEAFDIPVEEDLLVISRKITSSRSISKVNNMTVTKGVLQKIAGLVIDIHGQHEHQSLLYKEKHLEIVDWYLRQKIMPVKSRLAECYGQYTAIQKKIHDMEVPEEERLRRLSFMEFEYEEIEKANLIPGEEGRLEERYRELSAAGQLKENLNNAYRLVSGEGDSAGDKISAAVRSLSSIKDGGSRSEEFLNQLTEIEALLADFSRDAAEYLMDMGDYEEELAQVTERLDVIRGIKSRFGKTTEKVLAYAAELEEQIHTYHQYEETMKQLADKKSVLEAQLNQLCEELSQMRRAGSKDLEVQMTQAMADLNFQDVRFAISFVQNPEYSANGYDTAEFILSTNPGEDMKPLGQAASGGELSRVMLAIKAVLAEQDDIPTLIFDEIDVGISGRTAQKVSEKLALISNTHQVICITHLAQIAAMADVHYLIEKHAEEQRTVTGIYKLPTEAQVEELARILGGVKITDSVLANAKEMKEMAVESRERIRSTV